MRRVPGWLSGSSVDFFCEFHADAATASNITRAARLLERAQLDADAFIEQVFAARRIIQGRANREKRARGSPSITIDTLYDWDASRLGYEHLLGQRARRLASQATRSCIGSSPGPRWCILLMSVVSASGILKSNKPTI